MYPNSALFQEERLVEEGGGEGELKACLSSLFFLLVRKNSIGTSFHITQVGL